LSYLTGGYVLYPIAEVLSVFNSASKQVDGTFTLAPNMVSWAAGDALEEPHYYKQLTYAVTEFVAQYAPRPEQFVSSGKTYEGLLGVGARGWQIVNATPSNYYFGAGGSYNVPDIAYVVSGSWGNDFEVDAGLNAVARVHCNLNTCSRWDSTYKLFDLDSVSGEDYLYYAPQSNTATWQLGGQTYSFSPQAFTAATINVGTLNATTINGAVPAAAISSGTINAARLPIFGASGTTHAAGAVPDPGAATGATRYLREDGSWTALAGGGGTLAAQNANAIAVTGGSINGTIVGGTTPAAGTFTTLVAGSLTSTGSTGYAYANGSSPLTYSATVPYSAVTGVAPLANPTAGQNNYAPLASPTFTGTVTVPGASVDSLSSRTYGANGGTFQPAGSGTGPTISRNQVDAVAAMTSANLNASSTGHIHDFKNSVGVVAYIDRTGLQVASSFGTLSNCSSTASPAVCGSAAAGTAQVAAAAVTLTINTTAITANSEIGCLTYKTVGITAPTNMSSLQKPYVSAVTAGTSFTLTFPVAPATNAVNIGYCLVN
jgi:hypothetical protein